MGQSSYLREFSDSLKRVGEYPTNLVSTDTYPHRLQSYLTRLEEAQQRLCCEDGKAKLGFWTCEEQGCEFKTTCIEGIDQLRDFYKIDAKFTPGIMDPRSCFAFIRARTSRDRLLISRSMMSLLFTYNQVIPAFLDFVLKFGRQKHAQELHCSGFRSESRLLRSSNGMSIPELGRSGRDFRLCYNLVSVETSPSQKAWPWSIRQTAIHHSFDTLTGRASWIIIKGNDLIEKRVKEAADRPGRTDTSCFDTNSRSFASSLGAQLIYIDWAGENWHWYLNFLEDEAQVTTRRVLSADATALPKSLIERNHVKNDARQPSSSSHPWTKASRKIRQWVHASHNAPQRTQGEGETASTNDEPQFCFSDLQKIQYLEEKTKGAILMINTNLGVIGETKDFYQELFHADEGPDELRMNCAGDVKKFLRRASSTENDLRLQKSRAESLIQNLADRKSLLFSVLEYHNMEASRVLGESMHVLAQQTQQETVSMRIITLVTLFFLPATFICTLMSTDIIRWNSENGGPQERTVSTGAIKFFFAITFPLSCCTFSTWWYFNRRLARAQKGKEGTILPI